MTSPIKNRGISVEMLSSGAGLALLSALLFGASTPLAKLLLRGIEPWMLAGLLYLGSGLGLLTVTALARALGAGTRSEAAVRGRAWLWLLLATLFGGVAGPVLLMFGLGRTAATTAALLLNLEGVLTALIAWFVFRENFDRRIALGMLLIVIAGALASLDSATLAGMSRGALFVAAACLAWAIDNNLTRRISTGDPATIAAIKGIAAGAVNLA